MCPRHARISRVTVRFIGAIAPIALAAVIDGAEVSGNPYRAIVQRNAFDLHQARSEPPVEQKPEIAPPPKIQLTGVANAAGKDWALLEVTEASKPVKRPVLSNGQMIDGIELVQIDVAAGTVRLRVLGKETVVALPQVAGAGQKK